MAVDDNDAVNGGFHARSLILFRCHDPRKQMIQ